MKARVAVEMASTFGWAEYVGLSGNVLGMHRFGASAPIKDLLKKFGFTAENVFVSHYDHGRSELLHRGLG